MAESGDGSLMKLNIKTAKDRITIEIKVEATVVEVRNLLIFVFVK